MMQTILTRIRAMHDARSRIAHIPLRACPFCGRCAVLWAVAGLWRAECANYVDCGGSGPVRGTAEDAATAWNERRTAE